MSALATQQHALARALWARHPHEALQLLGAHAVHDALTWRGLRAYRSHGRALAARALAAAYPRVAERLGELDFAALASSLWSAQPPLDGDVAQWGGGLATHVESLPLLLQERRLLAQLARVEWAMHLAASAADARLDAGSFALLTQREPRGVSLQLAPGTAFVAGTLVWRQAFAPRTRELSRAEADFICALLEGASLGAALDGTPGFDFAGWLTPAVGAGLVTGARVSPPSSGDFE
jgi:hypothetical protein